MYMFNEAATLLNAGQNDEAAASAADKAIAADPKRADCVLHQGSGADLEGFGRSEDAEDRCPSGMRGGLSKVS